MRLLQVSGQVARQVGRPVTLRKKARTSSKGSLEELPFELGPGGIGSPSWSSLSWGATHLII